MSKTKVSTKTPTPLSTEVVAEWLHNKHCVMWGGRGWDITDSKEVVAAAEWLIREMESLANHVAS
jgi:hypothetical protein